jgi:hypothetical protein
MRAFVPFGDPSDGEVSCAWLGVLGDTDCAVVAFFSEGVSAMPFYGAFDWSHHSDMITILIAFLAVASII